MEYPFYKCKKCDYDIAELDFPIHPKQKFPKCPKCHSNENVVIIMGNENTVWDTEEIIFSDEIKGTLQKRGVLN